MSILAPPSQFPVVILTTDPRTLEQYDGLVATQQKTAAASKGKKKVVATIEDESNYGQSSSEDEQELEEGELAAQRFQRVQQNKKLAIKKANAAKAEAAQQYQAINDFSGHIPNGLKVKAKVPATIIYKYAPRGLPRTLYELEWLYKYYANEHVPHHDCVVMYMLISELLRFAQQLDDNLHDHTMQVTLSDPVYWDLKNPI
ncbi:hypothetical protein C0995_000445 [Termitomyces sp. Mi166|nr:hypothetical protein C0995_000445 [Termitomyces sp. Mi166\